MLSKQARSSLVSVVPLIFVTLNCYVRLIKYNTMTEECKIVCKNGKYYKMVAPDGGWGYMIALAMIIIMTVITAPATCFGIIYGEFLELHGINTGSVGLFNGVNFFCFSFCAFLANLALKRMSLRAVGLLGAALYSAGSLGLVFVDSLLALLLTGGVLVGSGSGLMITCILSAFNLYFTKKRVFVMSVCQTIICVLSILAPMMISASMREFGFRGTLALLCGVNLHSVVAFVLLQPVRRHLVREELQPTGAEHPEYEPLNPQIKDIMELSTPKGSCAQPSKILEVKDHKVKRSKMRAVVDYLDLSLLQDPVFLNVSIGISVVMVSDITFIILLPLHLQEARWTMDEVALMLTLLMVADAVARAALSVVSRFYSVNSRTLFLAGVIVMIVLRFGMFTTSAVVTVTAVCTALGFFRSCVMVTYPLVVADRVPGDKYAAAQGLQLLMTGMLSFLIGPMAGALRDVTGTYLATFHVLTAIMLVCAVPWTLEMVVARKRPVANAGKIINENI